MVKVSLVISNITFHRNQVTVQEDGFISFPFSSDIIKRCLQNVENVGNIHNWSRSRYSLNVTCISMNIWMILLCVTDYYFYLSRPIIESYVSQIIQGLIIISSQLILLNKHILGSNMFTLHLINLSQQLSAWVMQ